MNLNNYTTKDFYDELLTPQRQARRGMGKLVKYLKKMSYSELALRKQDAELAIKTRGITFTVYSEAGNIDRNWPYDIIPRVILQKEWQQIGKGVHDKYN